jgi:hypothetical protein
MPNEKRFIITRVEPELHNKVEAWRRQQPAIPSRSAALRELIWRGLQVTAKAKTMHGNLTALDTS